MENNRIIVLLALATALFERQSCAQGTVAPLYVFTNGKGTITPLQYGQLLEAGQIYEMTAVPGDGYSFSSWQLVSVFSDTETVYDKSGNPTILSGMTVSAVLGSNYFGTTLTFTMQPQDIIYDNPNVRTLSKSIGWQANFVPIPEPSEAMLMAGGFTAFVFILRRGSGTVVAQGV